MRTYIRLPFSREREIPQEFLGEDNRYPEGLVRCLLDRFTHRGNNVLDPFAGLGTTLLVAEEMGREAFGIERDHRRVEYVRSQIRNRSGLIEGDARSLSTYDLPPIDFSVTSPPYMPSDYGMDPLTEDNKPGTYYAYLADIESIYRQISALLRPGGRAAIEVSNLKGDVLTTFAWDVARAVSRTLVFEGETVVCWEGSESEEGIYGFGYDHSYCMVFRRPD